MTGEWTFQGQWFGAIGRLLSRLVFKRLAHIYGFTNMPPMPPRKQDVAARAWAVRKVLSSLDQATRSFLLLAPEGRDHPHTGLAVPPAGVGRFMALIAEKGLCILPAAGSEQDGALVVRFGPAYQLDLPRKLARDELDQFVSSLVMERIANLL